MIGLGVDIGGGSIKAGVFNELGEILRESKSKTSKSMNNSEFEKALWEAVDPLMQSYPSITGVGIGSPGPIDNESGTIFSSANLPYLDKFPITEIIRNKYSVDAVLNNDANSAAMGEYFFGLGKDSQNLFVFTLGTGLGGGWVKDGSVYNGYRGNGMEVGHITIVKGGALCGCGQSGCAESYFSATGLLNRYNESATSKLDDVSNLFSLARSNDPLAGNTLTLGVEVLAEASRNIVNLLNVDTIVFVGGLVKSWDLYGSLLEEKIRNSVFPVLEKNLNIYHGENQAILGAGALLLEPKK